MITTTTTVATTPPSVRVALFGDEPDVAAALARRLNQPVMRDVLGGEVRALSPAGQTAVVTEAARAAKDLFELDLLGVLVAGWRTHRELAAAAQATATAPGTSQVVRVYDHLVTSKHTPYVEVVAGAKRIARIDFPIDLTFRIHALEATIRGGRLVALHSGTCELEASLATRLATQEIPLIRRTVTVRLPLQVPLGVGIPLAEASPMTSNTSHRVETRRARGS
jgi:hypothetical protein